MRSPAAFPAFKTATSSQRKFVWPIASFGQVEHTRSLCGLVPLVLYCTIYIIWKQKDSIKAGKMSDGGSSLTQLTYLQQGVQDSTERQISDFDERVQVHFDWLASYSTAPKNASASYVPPNVPFSFQLNLSLLSLSSAVFLCIIPNPPRLLSISILSTGQAAYKRPQERRQTNYHKSHR